jgi:GntR family transcriptional regulator/MocR family aminotransferase
MSHAISALIALDRARGDLEGQLYRAMRERILHGTLPPGQRLPSTRVLALSLGLARSTVVHAYERLKAEGYLDASAGAASRVAGIARPVPLGSKPSAPKNVTAAADPLGSLPLTPGVPDLAAFPQAVWVRLLCARARRIRAPELGYGAALGLRELRQAILAHIAVTRGVVAEVDQLVVLPSTRAAIWLLAGLLLRPDQPGGATAWMEEPGYASAQRLLRAAEAMLVPVPCDDAGIDITRAGGPPPRLIYVTPSHQYPTGATMSISRRLAVLEVARATRAFVLEDDYDSEFQFDGRPIAALQGIDQHGVVVYAGTMSKVLVPGLRVAYAVLPPALLDAAREAMLLQGLSVPSHIQAALADFLREGYLRSHIRRMTPVYAARMAAFVQAMRAHCGDAIDIRTGGGGLQVAAWFRDSRLDDRAVIATLRAQGFGPQAISSMHLDVPRHGLLCGIAQMATEDAAVAAQAIATALRTA